MSGNPIRSALEKCLSVLENAKYSFTFACGVGATTAITSLLRTGDHIICGNDVYGGTNRFFRRCSTKHGKQVTYIDASNALDVVESIKPSTKVIFCSLLI